MYLVHTSLIIILLFIYLFMEIRLFANGCLDHEIIRMQNALEWQVLWANGIIFSNLENWI